MCVTLTIFKSFSTSSQNLKICLRFGTGAGYGRGSTTNSMKYQLTWGLRRIEVLTLTHTHRTEWCVWVYAYSFVGLSQLKQRHFLFTAARERAVCSINNVKAGEEITNCRLPAAILLSDASINRNNA